VGPGGALYVLNSFNDRVQVFTREDAFMRSWGSTGTGPSELRLGINGGIAVEGGPS